MALHLAGVYQTGGILSAKRSRGWFDPGQPLLNCEKIACFLLLFSNLPLFDYTLRKNTCYSYSYKMQIAID
ncbi:MAG TPA: hypothetical protein DCS30_07995 [Rhizobiales bacterium]|nr:hypothetical protein [Hyphomicrobiales bacterium]